METEQGTAQAASARENAPGSGNAMPDFDAGLGNVIAAETRLSHVDGEAGVLIVGGFALETLVENATFEETAYLLGHGRLPKQEELARFGQALAAARTLPQGTLDLLRRAVADRRSPIEALRMATATFDLESARADGAGDAVGRDADDWDARAYAVIARMASAAAAYMRLAAGLEPVEPDPNLSHAANFLYMIEGEKPQARRARALEVYLMTVADHGLNASTFTARVITSTGSDLVSAVAGAIGALKGPLHGGAPGPALDMVFEIGDASRAESVLRAKLAQGERLMGFGHRVYRVRDPRADVLAAAAAELLAEGEQAALYALAKAVEKTALKVLAEAKPGRRLDTNVEYYTALLLHGLGLASEMFTPVFAAGRVAGWVGHCREQKQSGRIIRPQARYVGDVRERWLPIEER